MITQGRTAYLRLLGPETQTRFPVPHPFPVLRPSPPPSAQHSCCLGTDLGQRSSLSPALPRLLGRPTCAGGCSPCSTVNLQRPSGRTMWIAGSNSALKVVSRLRFLPSPPRPWTGIFGPLTSPSTPTQRALPLSSGAGVSPRGLQRPPGLRGSGDRLGGGRGGGQAGEEEGAPGGMLGRGQWRRGQPGCCPHRRPE